MQPAGSSSLGFSLVPIHPSAWKQAFSEGVPQQRRYSSESLPLALSYKLVERRRGVTTRVGRLEQTLNKPKVVLVVGVLAVALNVLLYFGYFLPRMTPLIAHINPIGTSLPEAISTSDPPEASNKSDSEAGSKTDPGSSSNSDPEASGELNPEAGAGTVPEYIEAVSGSPSASPSTSRSGSSAGSPQPEQKASLPPEASSSPEASAPREAAPLQQQAPPPPEASSPPPRASSPVNMQY